LNFLRGKLRNPVKQSKCHAALSYSVLPRCTLVLMLACHMQKKKEKKIDKKKESKQITEENCMW